MLRLVRYLGLRLWSYHAVLRGLLTVSRASGRCAGFISHVMHSWHSLRHTRNQGRQALARLHVRSLLLLGLLLRMLLGLRLLWWLLRRLRIWMWLAIASRVLLVWVHVHAVALTVAVGCLLVSIVVYAVRSVLSLPRGRLAGVLLEVLLRRNLRVHRGHIRAFLPLVDV